MRKLFLAVVLLMVFSVGAFGQKDTNKIKFYPFISINSGIGMPLLQDNTNIYGTFALNGNVVNIYGIMPIKHSRFSIGGIIIYGSNKFDLYAYAKDIGSTTITSIGAENYDEYIVLSGVSLSIPGEYISIDFRLLGGPLYFKTPEIDYSGEFYTASLTGSNEIGAWSVRQQSEVLFNIDIGSSIKFKLTKKLFGLLNADIIGTYPDNGYYMTTQFTSSINSSYNYVRQENNTASLLLLNLTIGIGYRL
ncbi:MAG TPA: hypothetical protein VK809_08650 [Bacteroidia bacterium]|nr:hypothetical protein [Bacteroidia bacterium]